MHSYLWERKMNAVIQLDLFEKIDEFSLLRKEIDHIKKETGNVRRGMFQRHSDLGKLVLKIDARLDLMENRINAMEKTFSNGHYKELCI